MPIVRADLKLFYPALINDLSSNGGRMSANVLTSGIVGNIFPAASDAERTAGSQKFRKVFFKNSEVTTPAGLKLLNAKAYIENYSVGDDDVVMWLGTQTDTQSAYTLDGNNIPRGMAGNRHYGTGQLNADTSGGATVVTVAMHASAAGNFDYFVAGDTIRISDRTDVDDTGNNEVFATIAAGGVSGPVGDVWTLTLDDPLGPAFLAANTRVGSVLDLTSLEGSFDNVVVTSASGTFDSVGNPLLMDNEGTVEDGWTITFSDATNFTCSGAVIGSVGSGTIGANFAPVNPDFGKPYFTLPSAAWGGTFANTDTVTFDTHPAAKGVWVFRDIPAGIASITGNETIIVLEGESE